MKEVLKKIKPFLPFVLLGLWVLVMVPFFVGTQAAHPATDDFTFAAYTRPTWEKTGSILHVVKDALSYAARTWRDWQGTVTGVIVMALGPAVFTLEHYGVHAVLLIVLHLLAMFVFLRHMLMRRMGMSKRVFFTMYLTLTAAQLVFLPDMVEGLYWFNGAWFYTGTNALALLTLTLSDHWAASYSAAWKQVLMGLLAALLLFAIGMDNYITAMMTAAALLMMAIQRGWKGKQKREALRTALLLIPIGVGLALSVFAPGNRVRMAVDGAHQSGSGWLFMSILWTLRDAAHYLWRFLVRTPLLLLLCIFTPGICKVLNARGEAGRRCPPIWATILGCYLILCAMIIPHVYSSGNAGSGRVINMYHLYVLTAVPIAWVMIFMKVHPLVRRRIGGKHGSIYTVAIGMLAVISCLEGEQVNNYVKLVSDQHSGVQAAYIEQFKNEYALCEAAGPEDDVILPAWTVQTMTGKPTVYEDPTVWTNESMAHYFDVKSVRTGE